MDEGFVRREQDRLMTTTQTHPRRFLRGHRLLFAAVAVLVIAVATIAAVLVSRPDQPARLALPLQPVGQTALPGDSSRFDYASLDAGRGLLFIAHLGASEVIETDVRTGRVVRTIGGLSGVHGVLVVPARHRVYATATSDNAMVVSSSMEILLSS